MVPRRRRARRGPGLTFLGHDGYHMAPFVGAEVERVGLPGHPVQRRAPRRGGRQRHRFPVSMARGATWDPELEERIGDAIGRELRAVGANLTGAVCVNLLRHPAWGRAQETYGEDPAPRRRAGRGADPGPAAPRDGVREALRLQLDGERPLHASTSRSTRSPCTRCTSRTSAASSTRASPR